MLSRRNVNLKMLYWSSKNLSVSQPEFPVKRVDRNEKSSMSQSQKTEKVHFFVKSTNTYDSLHVRWTSYFKKDLGFPKGIYIYNSYSPIHIRYD